MPISRSGRRAILAKIPSDFEGRIVDLGSGFGSFIFAAAKKCKRAEIIGVESAKVALFFTKVWRKPKNVKIIRGDIYQFELKSTDIVFCYLYPGAMQKLNPKARLISYAFALPSQKPTLVETVGKLYPTNIYYYP